MRRYKHEIFHLLLAETADWKIYGTLIVDLLINPGVFDKEFHLKWTRDFLYLSLHHPEETNANDILMETQIKF